MPAGIWFWLIFVICLVAYIIIKWPFAPESRRDAGVVVILFILIALLGIGIFGWPVR